MSAYTKHGKTSSLARGTLGENQHWQKGIVVQWEGFGSKNHTTTAAQLTAELNIYLEDPVYTKTVRRELHESSVHGGAAIAKSLITESDAQMRKRWCHDRKTWTSDSWKRARHMVRWVVLHAVPHIRKSLRLENIQGSLQSGMPGSVPKVKHGVGSVMLCAAISCYSILLVPLLPFMVELLQGSTWKVG
jgi:hypothetical protein